MDELHAAIQRMAEVWEDTADAGELYAAMQWSELVALADVLHASERDDVAGSILVWWMAANPDTEVEPDTIHAALNRYGALD